MKKQEKKREPVVVALDLYKKIRIEVDTSDYISKGVLSINYEDRK